MDNRLQFVDATEFIDGEQQEDAPPAIALSFYNECSQPAPKRHLIKGVMAKGETSSWIGPPGSGKSALITDIACHIGSPTDWRGYRTKEKAGFVIFAFERADLCKRRLAAYVHKGLENLPIAVGSQIIDLMNPSSVDVFAATIRAAEDRFGCGVGAIAIDTFAKGIAAGNGDEDKARDQNRALANLRRVHEQFDLHIAIIGHTGKDENRGARGSNAHLADVDVMVQIRSAGHLKTAEVVKANDQADGPLTTFKLDVLQLGQDEDGEDITTAIVSEQMFDSTPVVAGPKLTKNQQTMFSILHDAGQHGLTTEEWNRMGRDADIGVKRKADHVDIRSALKAKKLVREYNGRWTVAA
jgi:hypothetical protein